MGLAQSAEIGRHNRYRWLDRYSPIHLSVVRRV